MKVVGFVGRSGAGKTTLMEQLIAGIKSRDLRVSVVKQAHHAIEIDTPGKDSWRHREAGAFEVVVASPQRLVLIREYDRGAELPVHHALAELYEGVDWALVEGFSGSDLLKIEIWRAASGQPALYPHDPFIAAIATDSPDQLPEATLRPVLDLNRADGVAQWLVDNAHRFEYNLENYAIG